MKIFLHIASRRNRRTIVAVFEVKKEIPDKMLIRTAKMEIPA
jgi:hypothetical protein